MQTPFSSFQLHDCWLVISPSIPRPSGIEKFPPSSNAMDLQDLDRALREAASAQRKQLLDLPNEVVVKIMSCTHDIDDTLRLGVSCKRLYSLLDTQRYHIMRSVIVSHERKNFSLKGSLTRTSSRPMSTVTISPSPNSLTCTRNGHPHTYHSRYLLKTTLNIYRLMSIHACTRHCSF